MEINLTTFPTALRFPIKFLPLLPPHLTSVIFHRNASHSEAFKVQVKQTFGNCPQYIQSRMFELLEFGSTIPKPIHEITAFSEPEHLVIVMADTFFIAIAYQDESAGLASGVDVSHRGGKPGFVRVDSDRRLTIPDFFGNCHFNTFGNLELNPKAGLLFIVFDKGNLL